MNQKCQMIDMAVPADRNTTVKVEEKLSKYKDLELEIVRMWKMETETIPLENYVDRISGTTSISELQKPLFSE